jgi:hypothetical protein
MESVSSNKLFHDKLEKAYPFPTLWIITAAGRKDEVEKMPNAKPPPVGTKHDL